MSAIRAMSKLQKLLCLTAAALLLIALGSMFLIAPLWLPQGKPAEYVPVTGAELTANAPAAEQAVIDINSADAEELTALPGIGPEKAAALVAYRTEHGPFATLADAAAVKGISERMTESWAGLAEARPVK